MSKHNHFSFAALLGACLALLAPAALAEDIDIFLSKPSATTAPNVLILLDNNVDWVGDSPNGKGRVAALQAVINSIGTSNPVHVGLAMGADDVNGTTGSYIRFGIRDMSVAAHRTTFNAMLDVIATDSRVTQETGENKNEAAWYYEIWRYFRRLKPSAFGLKNKFVDIATNSITTGVDAMSTAASYGLTTGNALATDTSNYSGPPASACGKNYLIYISSRNGNPGSQSDTAANAPRRFPIEAGDVNNPVITHYDAGPKLPDISFGGQAPLHTWANEWAKFMLNPAQSDWPSITTYVIDGNKAGQTSGLDYGAQLRQVAKAGGGTYKEVSTQAAMQAELFRIFAEIQAVNSAFASAALPVNATSRSQNENQVFIGTFRPDQDAKPRWFGNLKQYQLIVNSAGGIELGDVNKAAAVDPSTGFFKECAVSFYTSDSSSYWQNAGANPIPAGKCVSGSLSYSDSPDGPFVEKGGVAEVVRKGNNPPYPTNAATNSVVRNTYTLSSAGARVDFTNTTLDTLLGATTGPLVARFTRGEDVNAEVNTRSTAAELQLTRPSLHGDVVHSRALPVNYGLTTGTVVYYGANDGTLRAVEVCKNNQRVKDIDVTKPKDESCVTPSGKEKWAFVAPEHYGKLKRLMDQGPFLKYPDITSPSSIVTFPTTNKVNWPSHGLSENSTISFTTTGTLPSGLAPNTQYYIKLIVNNDVADASNFNITLLPGSTTLISWTGSGSATHTGVSPATAPKDYFFDGGIGTFQNLANTKVWIFPSMRRGGRMVYAFDVTDSANPLFKWKVGCPNPGDDSNCVKAGATSGSAPVVSADFAGIGQTWSLPSVARVKGFSTSAPVVVIGGGYDACEDADSKTPSCSSPKGAAVYVLNADTGALLRKFTATGMRSVAADVAFVDTNGDNMVDHAYVVDTGGGVYRIDFVNSDKTEITDPNNWTMTKIAGTNATADPTGARKFLFPPALLFNNNQVYLAIGSGDRERPLISNYPYVGTPGTAAVVNRFYVFLDDPTKPTRPVPASPPAYTPIDLDSTTSMVDKTTDSGCSAAALTPGATEKGWFIDLTANGRGEQTVTSAVVIGGLVTFSTNRPLASVSAECQPLLGQARGYFLNLLTGAGAIGVSGSCGGDRSDTFVGGGLPPSPVTATIIVDDVPRTVVIGAIQRSGDPSSAIQAQELKPPIIPIRKRIYWYTPGTDN